ncbi:MAG: aldehyde dehydrogenase family protein [Bacteroidetes bacterium]|nr:aldehyde dehydrogenase family protein [Bacteroidota bacterium]
MTINKKSEGNTSVQEINRVFQLQKEYQYTIGMTKVSERRAKLKKFQQAILKYRPQIKEALYQDFRKHPSEVDITEIYPMISQIKHARRNLSRWMGRHHVDTPLSLIGSRSHIRYEPKGVVLIISPWNFPIMLTFGPLVSAIAAGNTVIIKPSELTPNASKLMKKIIQETFCEEEVALFEGGVETSTNLLALPFNHIFFTGAPQIGKIVMTAAAKNLASVTLELGGKSPTIVLESANVDLAAKRIAWAKFMNNGQVCIAPDYVLVHESQKAAFVEKVKKYIKSFYSEKASQESSYCRMVNERHHNRVKNLYEDAVNKGAKVETGGAFDGSQNYISPTVVTNISNNSDIMEEEIFGPILPVISFTDVNEMIKKINSREKPLALYIYGKNRKSINHILANTRAGGGCINQNGVHFFNLNLPFGGSNNSGIGKGNGIHGFKAFSNARGILKQHIPNALDLLYPPYNSFKQKLIDLTIKYF